MQSIFKYSLSEEEIRNIDSFCDSSENCSVDQLIGWSDFFYKARVCYFYLHDESGIRSYCQIKEGFKCAHIYYGPVCNDKELILISIEKIIAYYRQKGYFYLGIQMYCKTGFDVDYIEYALNKKYNIKYFFNNLNTKSSIEIDLGREIEDIWKDFREGHKKSVKKAQKLGMTISEAESDSDLDAFVSIVEKMCKTRNISNDGFPVKNIREFYSFLKSRSRGTILLAKDDKGVIVGVDMLVYQGSSVVMYKGATDPDRRELPISHLLIYEAIIKAKNDNFKYFDFWGYNHFADEKDQVFYINQFKKGFGGYFTFFAKKMNISLIPYGYYMYVILNWMRKLIGGSR
ncbi:MAG TPA: peptidoglycan bridge formation glycyltransferase FemA/FemB family protein [Bacteroidales bacterium]|jgi:lipid II:glycine glycyltransferase (peptidoglycan interpeptide bridge formation enzyme)|nr:peptidoglycan bridge formation glycyltransferase FemA/FemB family protein [Bacteroidales bacterium]